MVQTGASHDITPKRFSESTVIYENPEKNNLLLFIYHVINDKNTHHFMQREKKNKKKRMEFLCRKIHIVKWNNYSELSFS